MPESLAAPEPIARILVPVDGSEGARRALAHALHVARAVGAHVTVLEVIEEPGPLPTFDERPPAGETREHWLAEERIAPLRPLLSDTDVPWERRVEQGVPPDVICRVAEEGHDLIVIGHRGLSTVGRWLVGSVSDRVVHHAPCSVTVVK